MNRNMHQPNCGCGCGGHRQHVQPMAHRPQYVQPMPNQSMPMANQHMANQPMANQPIAQQPFRMQPIVAPPLCRYTDSYTEREIPVIQPLININRQHIVDVPKTYYEQINENVVVSPYQNSNPCGGRNRYPRC